MLKSDKTAVRIWKHVPLKPVLLSATAMALSTATPIFAQTTPAGPPPEQAGAPQTDTPNTAAEMVTEDTDAIIVTARRSEERLQDVPISITVFNQEQITQRNIVNVADLGTYTPSLSTNSKYGSEKASFVIRGFVQDLATQPSVGVYFADVVAPRAGGSTTSGNGVGIGNLFDLQNVQVLKGPQGTLFGRNTTGGAVLLVPRKPTDELEGYVEFSAGNYNMLRGQAVLNVPISEGLRVRLGVDRMERDGYLKNHSGIGPDRLGDVNFLAARLSVVADITENLENYLIATYSNSNNNGILSRVVGCNNGQFPGFAASPLAPFCNTQLARQNARGDGWWDVENSEPDPISHQKTWQVINTTTWTANDNLTVKNIASYGEFRETTRYSLEGEFYTTPGGQLAQTLIRLNNTPGHYNAIQSTFTEELQFQGQAFNDRLNWQAGGYYEKSDPIGFTSQATAQLLNCQNTYQQLEDYLAGRIPTISCPATQSGSISIPFQKTWFRSKGLYAQGTYKFTEQFSLTAGFRYTWDTMRHRYDGTSVGFPIAAPGTTTFRCPNVVRLTPGSNTPINIPSLDDHEICNVTFTSKSKKPTWLIDFDYKPNDDILLYAKWARGYRAGGVASANILFETWEPEKVDTYEIGAKTSFRGGSVRGYFNVAAFYNDFQNQQIQATLVRSATSPLIGGSAIINAGKSRIWGFEIDSSVTFFDIFRLDAGYTYLNTKVLEIVQPELTPELAPFYSRIVLTAFEGDPLALAPKHRLSLTGTVTLPIDERLGRLSIGATYVYTSKQIASRATPEVFGVLPSSHLINLNLSWNDFLGEPIDLSAFVTNLTNEKFPLNVNNAFGSFGLESQIINEPRMIGARVKFRFGD